jgi:hypothetical protein
MLGNTYRRYFMIFRQEDAGFGAMGIKPTGHMKIEIRGDRGRLDAFFSGLADIKDGFYKLCLVRTKDERVNPVEVGSLHPGASEGHIRWVFNPADVSGSGFGIDEWDTAVLIVHEKKTDRILCPLAAYMDGKTDWRKYFKKERNEEYGEKEEIKSENDTHEESYMKAGEDNLFDEECPADMKSIERIDDINEEESKRYENNMETENGGVCTSVPDNKDNGVDFAGIQEVEEAEGPGDTEPGTESGKNGEYAENGKDMSDITNAGEMGSAQEAKNTENAEKSEEVQDFKIPGDTEPSGEQQSNREERKGPEIEKLERMFNKDFKKVNPFRRARSDYDWWKVESPVHFNNILHFCGIKAPLLFNNDVMTAHYKYRHLLAGIFRDDENLRWFLVCGIPGAFMVDPSPFGNMCRWVRAGGQRPGFGSMGYWLVYIDPNTGNILKIN